MSMALSPAERFALHRRMLRELVDGVAQVTLGDVCRRLDQARVRRLEGKPDAAHEQRERHHRRGQRRTLGGESQMKAESLFQPAAHEAPSPQQNQQKKTYQHRRQDHRQMHQPIQCQLSWQVRSRQCKGRDDSKGQRADHGQRRNMETGGQDFEFRWGHSRFNISISTAVPSAIAGALGGRRIRALAAVNTEMREES